MHTATILKLVIFYAESGVHLDQEFLVEALCAALEAMEEPSG